MTWGVNNNRRAGSALIMVIWTIAVLSILVMSFAVEAKLQSAANVYVRERVHMDHLIDVGRVLGEMVIANHQDVVAYSENENVEELLEDDRWLLEKRQLKQSGATVTIGPIAVDEQNPDDGTVTVQIESVGGGDGGGPKININSLYPQGNPHYAELWENILYWVGVPEDDQDYFVNSWVDWRDDDDVMVGPYNDQKDSGGEKAYYEDLWEDADGKANGEDKQHPRNGPIPDLKELASVGAFREHPAVLTGGWYYPLEDVKEDSNIFITNKLETVLDVFGGDKINVNLASLDVLMCIPGIRDADDPEDGDTTIAQAIIDWRNGLDMDGNAVDVENEENGTLIKDWTKLNEITQGEIGKVAQEYLSFTGGSGDGALYRITITATAMGMSHVVKAKMTIKESAPVYLEWQENP